MTTRFYRPTVFACALAWFMVGLHVPALHHATSHEGTLPVVPLLALALLAAVGAAALWLLLRRPVTAGVPSSDSPTR